MRNQISEENEPNHLTSTKQIRDIAKNIKTSYLTKFKN